MKKTLLSIVVMVIIIVSVKAQGTNYNHRIWAINCGYSEKDIIDGFIPDTFAVQGTALWFWGTNSVSVEGVKNAAPGRIYETTRFEWNGKDVEYKITGLEANKTYLTRLHFGELSSAVGARVFDIIINEIPYEIGFDIYAINGVKAKALVRDYETSSSESGIIDILFTNVQADNACINGIEIYAPSGVGIKQVDDFAADVKIFPNPASDNIEIRSIVSEIKTVSIFDIQGRQIYNSKDSFISGRKISLESFSKGFYIVRITTGGKTINKTLIVN